MLRAPQRGNGIGMEATGGLVGMSRGVFAVTGQANA